MSQETLRGTNWMLGGGAALQEAKSGTQIPRSLCCTAAGLKMDSEKERSGTPVLNGGSRFW